MDNNYMKTILSGVKEWTENLTDDAIDKANNALDKANNALDKANNSLGKALFVVNITQNSGTFSADKTFEEISKVYNEGKYNIVANFAINAMNTFIVPFLTIMGAGAAFGGIVDMAYSTFLITPNNKVQMEMIPLATTDSKLPNPYALTFTGAVSETYDGSSAKTIEIPSGGSGARSDWNQNDSTAADYIKNRPFYMGDPVETVLVEERTVSFVGYGGIYAADFQSTFVPTVGETYKVSWDGTVYECTCVNFSGNTLIGNLSIAGAGSDTGEPFVIGVNNRGAEIYTLDTSASHTFSISGFVTEVVKIDEKYIPYNIARTSNVDEKLANCIKTVNGTAPDASGNVEVQTISEDVLSADQYGEAIIVKCGVVFKKRLPRYSTLYIGKPNVALLVKEGKTSNVEDTVFAFSAAIDENEGNSLDSILLSRNGIDFRSENVVINSLESANTSTDVIQLNSSTSHGVMVEITKHACFVLPSSTKGSTKKFKITVDDSGTISATEVV